MNMWKWMSLMNKKQHTNVGMYVFGGNNEICDTTC